MNFPPSFAEEIFNGNRYQSGSFSLFIVRSVFRCLRIIPSNHTCLASLKHVTSARTQTQCKQNTTQLTQNEYLHLTPPFLTGLCL